MNMISDYIIQDYTVLTIQSVHMTIKNKKD